MLSDEHYKAVMAELKAINKKLENNGMKNLFPVVFISVSFTIIGILTILTWMY